MVKEMKDLGVGPEIWLARSAWPRGLKRKNARLAVTRPGVWLFPLR